MQLKFQSLIWNQCQTLGCFMWLLLEKESIYPRKNRFLNKDFNCKQKAHNNAPSVSCTHVCHIVNQHDNSMAKCEVHVTELSTGTDQYLTILDLYAES